MKRARARHRLSEHERGSQEGRAAPIWRAREPSAGFLSRREGGHPSVHVSSVLASSAKIWWEGSHGSVFARRVGGRFANTHTLYSHIFQTKSASFNLDYRSTTASDGSFLWFGRRPSASAAVGASSASSIGETFVSFIVGTSARVVDPSIHRSSRAARLTNTLVRSRALWDLSRPLSSSARGTRAPPRVEACVPAGVWKRGSCRPRVPPRTRPRAGRRPRTPGP